MGSSRWPRSISTARRTIRGPAEVDDGVQGCPDGAAGIQDVVDQHHNFVVDAGARQLGGVRRAGGLVREVVAEHGDVQLADDRGGVHGGIRGGDLGGEADGEGVAPARDAQQDEVLGALVGLKNFMGDTSERAVDVSLVEDNPGEYNLAPDPVLMAQKSKLVSPFPASRDGIKKGLFALSNYHSGTDAPSPPACV